MAPNYNKIHNRFKLNKRNYLFNELKEVAYSYIKEGFDFEKQIGSFLLDWLDNKSYVIVNTSGTTGKPKPIKLNKQAMVNSAIATGNFFNLKPGDSALHCLPSNFIAGKMMLVRALVLGLELELIEPKTKLAIDTNKHYNFCAMIPLQVQHNLNKLNTIENLIVGGASVSIHLKEKIQKLNTKMFETYGMTETITHIAVKQLNQVSNSQTNFFKTLPNVEISQDKRNCLVIKALKISETPIITNDVVNTHSTKTFEWLGRFDNIINSGGVKLNPEQIENKLKKSIAERFFLTSEKHDRLGEQLILIIEANEFKLKSSVFKDLNKFETPKKTYFLSRFNETETGKINRKKTLKQIK